WSTRDQSWNHPDRTRQNARVEGVADRIAIVTGDARALPFADASVDAVVSSWVLHNLPDAEGRAQALREIARVLRPQAKLALADIGPPWAYARVLTACGLRAVARSRGTYAFVLPTSLLTAQKPRP